MEIKIRPMVKEDVEFIVPLCEQFGFPATRNELSNRFNLIRKYSNQQVFVAVNTSHAIVGWVHAYEAPSLLSNATVEIGGLIVDEKSRRQGVGKALMKAVEKWAKERGFDEILLATRIDRLGAQNFYKALGYKFVHTTHFFQKGLE